MPSTLATTSTATGVHIPPELAYILPANYSGDANANFIDTTTGNASINDLLAAARNSTFYAYDDEFYDIIGQSPAIISISASNSSFTFATEGGAWLPDRNEVWFDGGGDDPLPFEILDLETFTVRKPSLNKTGVDLPPTLAGATYYNGTVFFAFLGLKTASAPPAVYAVDPTTYTASVVLNSYGGIPLNSIDDLSWASANTSSGATSCTRAGEDNLFLTSLDLGANGETLFSDAVLPNAVYRFTPSTKSLQAVISRADILAPNGVQVDPTSSYLYVSDVAYTALTGPGSNSSGSAALYKYDLDQDCNPVNKRLFAAPRSGFADGIRLDRQGRVWTAEANGVVVRNSRGRELGVFNVEQLADEASGHISEFSLAGDKLVVLGGDRISVIQLAQNVTEPARSS